MILPITLTFAGAAALLNIWIAKRVGALRHASKISIGDGGNDVLAARMRAHANFVEYTPFVLILVALIEMAVGSATWLWAVGAVYLLARICHAFGMDRRQPDPLRLRLGGIVVTLLVLAGLALYAIVLPYLVRPHASGVSYAAALR
jgi:uncharacterized membrane protein YecN with MAPEG domain